MSFAIEVYFKDNFQLNFLLFVISRWKDTKNAFTAEEENNEKV